ncbi:Hypothetical protein, putative [Bodo saltans]|uniref:Uncharacterized protein n=1 Tax=Bodo saltans TaxID=75058 RepID=A0A0S4IUP8_BODSA|nr:Hypothetical protein, putative [Bodo saltans]|eukprot:CUF95277.1 Hypothetical protein, putative [Bodo saltans]
MIEFGDETANEADRYDIAGDSDDTEDDDMSWGQKDDDDDENSVHDRSGADDPYPLSSSPGFDRRDDVHQDQEWRSHQVASRQQLAQFDRVEDISSPFYDRGGSGALEPVTPQRGGYNSDGISISATTPSRARASSTTSSITQVLLRSHVNLTFGVRSDASIASSYGMSSTDGTRGGLRSKVLRRLGSQAKQAVENIKSTSMAEYIVELRGPSSIDAAHRSLVDEGDIVVYRLPKVSGDSKSPKLGPLCDDGDVVFHRPLSEMLDAGLKDLGRRDTVTFRYVAKQYVHELAYHKTGSVAGEARKPGGDLLTKSVSMLDGHHSSDGGSGSLEGSLKDLRASDSAVLPPALREIESQDPLTTFTATTVAPAAPGRTSSTTAPKDKKDGSNLLYRRLKLYLPPQPCFGSIGLSLHFATIHHSKKKTMNKKQPTHELHQDPLSMSAADKKPQVTDGDRNSVKYNYLDIRFDNSSTRDKWWDILRPMLGTQLLQHVREGSEDEAEIRRVEAQAVIDDMVGHRPAVEKFVEYFRSDLEDPADVQTDGAVAVRNTSDPPDGGVLEVVFGPLHRKPRKLSIGKMQTRGPDGEQILRDGTGTSEPHLVIGPCNLRQRLRMVPSHAFPLRTLTVCAQDDQWGNTFYLERRDEASVKHSLLNVHSRKILVERAAPVTTTKLLKLPSDALGSTTVVSSPRWTPSPGSLVQSPTTRLPSMGPPGRDDPLTDAEFPNSLDEHASSLTPPQVHEAPSQHLLAPITSATPAREEDHGPYLRIELSTRSFVQRLKWMQWFTRILGKPVVYVHDSTRDTSGPLQDTDDAGAVEAGGAVTLVEGEDGTITRIVHRRPMFSWLYAKPAAPAPLTTSVIQRSSSLLQNRSFPPLHSSKSMSTSPSTTTARVSGRSSPTTSPTDDRDAKNNHHEALVEGGESIAAAASIPPAAVLKKKIQ